MLYWFTDLIIPLFTTGLGTLTRHRPPEYGKSILYRTKKARQNQRTWDFANRRLGEFWFKIGIVLIVSVLLHRAFSQLDPMYTTAINIAAALAGLIAAYPIVDRALQNHFDEEGRVISSDTK